MVSSHSHAALWGRVAYGALFVLLLPALLLLWALRLAALLPPLALPAAGWGIAPLIVGALLLARAVFDLATVGEGLPMNAYPPARFVQTGAYGLLRHPIYVAAVLLSGGAALLARSPAGLYVVTPALALGALSLVLGYERLALVRLFGAAAQRHQPLLALPLGGDAALTFGRRLALALTIGTPTLAALALIAGARGAPLPAEIGWLLLALPLGALLLGGALRARWLAVVATIAALAAIYLALTLPLLAGAAWGDLPAALRWGAPALALAGALAHRPLWALLLRLTQRVANSRRDFLFLDGRLRVISHALFAGLAGAVTVAIGGAISGSVAACVVLMACCLVGSALFAQAWWGSASLQRPYGFWGGVIGGAVGIWLAGALFGVAPARLLLAAVLAVPYMQAIGRLRCLAQGCCHGVPTDARFGIRVWQPQSRVVLLSKLAQRPILPTQLYSIGWNVLLGPLLWGLWRSAALPVTLIAGAYLLLTALERFAEDGYRGETQTKRRRGLLDSQWVALAALGAGWLLTLLPGPLLAATRAPFSAALLGQALLAGLLPAFMMGVDFPRLNRRFARLSG